MITPYLEELKMFLLWVQILHNSLIAPPALILRSGIKSSTMQQRCEGQETRNWAPNGHWKCQICPGVCWYGTGYVTHPRLHRLTGGLWEMRIQYLCIMHEKRQGKVYHSWITWIDSLNQIWFSSANKIISFTRVIVLQFYNRIESLFYRSLQINCVVAHKLVQNHPITFMTLLHQYTWNVDLYHRVFV